MSKIDERNGGFYKLKYKYTGDIKKGKILKVIQIMYLQQQKHQGPPIMNEKVIYYSYNKDDTDFMEGPISYNEVLIKNKEKEIPIYKISPTSNLINLQQLQAISKYEDIDDLEMIGRTINYF